MDNHGYLLLLCFVSWIGHWTIASETVCWQTQCIQLSAVDSKSEGIYGKNSDLFLITRYVQSSVMHSLNCMIFHFAPFFSLWVRSRFVKKYFYVKIFYNLLIILWNSHLLKCGDWQPLIRAVDTFLLSLLRWKSNS